MGTAELCAVEAGTGGRWPVADACDIRDVQRQRQLYLVREWNLTGRQLDIEQHEVANNKNVFIRAPVWYRTATASEHCPGRSRGLYFGPTGVVSEEECHGSARSFDIDLPFELALPPE